MSTYAKADRAAQWFGGKFSSATMTPNCVVWHSTETFGWPGYSGGSMAPGYTVLPDVANQRVLWRAHFEDEKSSRALVNAPGGVETNTANTVQVEVVGTCNPAWAKKWPGTSKVGGRDYLYLPDAPDWFLAGLADFAADMNRRHGVPLTSGVSWAPYPGSYGVGASQRMSFSQWRAFVGHCGHQHVPENDHGDPGALPMGRILALAKGPAPAPTPAPAPAPVSGGLTMSDVTDILAKLDAVSKQIGDPLQRKDGTTIRADHAWQNADRKARFEALTAAVQALAGANGADPAAVAGIVDKAVRDRLAQVRFDVTDAPTA